LGCFRGFALILSVVPFFFQAEDGIRDRNVTGVQTCALPIFPAQIDGDTTMVGFSRRVLLGGLGAAAVGGATSPPAAANQEVSIPADVPPADYFRKAKIRLMDRDNLRGPATAISRAQQYLTSMEQLVPNTRGTERHQLTEVQAQM